MRAQGWKVPTVFLMVAFSSACGQEAQSAADRDSQRLVAEVPISEMPAEVEEASPAEQPVAAEHAGAHAAPPTPAAPRGVEAEKPAASTSEAPVLVRTDSEPSVAPSGAATLRPEAVEEPEPALLAVPAGTRVVMTVEEELSTEVSRAGDTFDAIVSEDVLGGSGVVLVPMGSRVRGVVLESAQSPGSDQPAILSLGIERVELADRLVPVVATVTELEHEAETRDSNTRTAAKVGAGAVAGALIGRIIGGGGDDALKGAAAGVAAGAAVAHATRSGHAKVPQGARMVVVLDQDMVVEAPSGVR